MSAPQDSSGTMTYWLNGEPFIGVQKTGNDSGSMTYWFNGRSADALFLLAITTIRAIQSDAEISTATVRSIQSTADIAGTTIQTVPSDADIKNTTIQTISSIADIKKTATKTILSDAEIVFIRNKVVFSDAFILTPIDLQCQVGFEKNSLLDRFFEVEVIQVTPNVPFNVTIVNVGSGDNVRISWDGTASFFNVYRVDPGPVYTKMNSYLISDHFYVIGGLQEGITYTFVVRGADGQG